MFISTVTETRTCTKCNETKHVNAFGKDKKHRGGKTYTKRTHCRSCENAQHAARLKRTPGKNYENIKKYRQRHPLKRRGYELKAKYGLTLEQYDALLALHNNGCHICGNLTTGTTNGAAHFMVDHCHKTLQVRGLLCTNCNRGLGNFKDSPELLLRAIDYLNRTSR
mgnify:CR=1 FL=1